MIKTCKICGKQFETDDKRKKYCSEECAKLGRNKNNAEYNRERNSEKRMEWAYHEAEKIRIDGQDATMDELATYIYNNYNKRRK